MLQIGTLLFRLLVAVTWISAAQFPAISYSPLDRLLQADASPPVIDVWYGTNQTFPLGTAQNYVNILGTVSDPQSGISSLTYTLNGGSSISLNRGPTRRRLAEAGDFNADIPVSALSNGPNTVTIRAVNGDGVVNTATVTVNYNSSPTWPLPYSINWSSVSNPQQALWIVDGKWQKTAGGIRTTQVAYDRVLAIGDLDWTEYEVTVPITVHGIDSNYFGDSISSNPGMGVNIHWTGHTTVPASCPQPLCGWEPTGASAWYEWLTTTNGRIKLTAEPPAGTVLNNDIEIGVGDTYWWKVRNEASGGGTLYRMKVWPNGQAEPDWMLSKQTDAANLDQGSLILVAHHVDVTFGNVSVTPLNQSPTYTLTTSTASGSGSITVNPSKPAYNPGEMVTLTANPAAGWSFSSWSGGASGSNNPISITMTGNLNVQATFIQNQPELDQRIYLPISVR